jgi:hypothetical protein
MYIKFEEIEITRQSFLSYSPLRKHVRIKIRRKITLRIALYMFETFL